MNGLTQTNFEFKDEPFEIVPGHVKLPDQHPADSSSGKTEEKDAGLLDVEGISASASFTENELMYLSQSMVTIPTIFFPKIPERTDEQVRPFNHQLYVYCKKKGINPWDYFFDEFGLIMAGLGLGSGIWQDYQKHYKKDGDKISASEKEKKEDSQYYHDKELAEKKEKENEKDKDNAGIGI